MQQDTRKLLTTGSIILGAGILCVLLMFGIFGGADHQGPHSNGGWLMVIVALGCLPMGLLISALGLAKHIRARTRGGVRS